MPITISLSDNSQHTLSIDFINLSSVLKHDMINHIHTSIDVFNKIKEFGTYYLCMDSKEKKIFENIDKIWDKPNTLQNWCENYLEMPHNILIELTNESFKLNIKPLVDLCCYRLASIIRNNKIDKLRDIFQAEDNFTPDEKESIDKETKWL